MKLVIVHETLQDIIDKKTINDVRNCEVKKDELGMRRDKNSVCCMTHCKKQLGAENEFTSLIRYAEFYMQNVKE